MWQPSGPESAKADRESAPVPDGVLLRLRSDAPKDAPRGVPSSFACVAYSPDGKKLATGGFYSPLRLWDASTGKEIRRFEASNGTIDQVTFSPDGRLLASTGQDKIVHLWDPTTGNEVGALRGHTGWVRSMAFSRDGKALATGDQEKAIFIWDLPNLRHVRTLSGCNGLVRWISFSPDGKALASASEDETIRLWDLTSGKETRSWEGERISCVAFNPTSDTLVMTGKGLSVWVRDAASGKAIHQIGDDRVARTNSLAYSPDGRLIVGGGPNELFLWEASTGKLVMHIRKDFAFGSRCLAFSPDGRALATAGSDEAVLVWDLTGWRKQQPAQRPDLTADQLTALWSDLAAEDAAKAHRAIWSLVSTPKQALPILKSYLKPVADDPREAMRWIEQLEDDSFEVRKKAAAELEKFGGSAVSALRHKLAEQPSPEVRRQIERLLEKAEAVERNAHRDRMLAVLEYTGTPEAQAILKSLASGSAESPVTQDAKKCLERLAKRGVANP
jgi:WD40 repeat protein